MLRRYCVEGITADEAVCRRYVEASSAAATALVPEIGYDAACEVVKAAAARGVTVRTAAVDGGFVSAQRFDELLTAEAVCRLGSPTPLTKGSGE
jgi:fumarate hydratase class II